MRTTITGRHFEISDAIRTYATEKAEKLERVFDGISEVEVLLKGEDRRFHCELIIHVANKPNVVIDVAHDSMYAAIDLAMDKAQRQVRRHKERLRERRHSERRHARAPEGAAAEEPGPEND